MVGTSIPSLFPMRENEGIQKRGWVFCEMLAFFCGGKISLDTQEIFLGCALPQ